MELIGRGDEVRALDELLSAVCAGQSRTLILSGPPGIGKTALLEEAAARAADCRVVRIAGIESEMEFAYAALQLMCAAMWDDIDAIPVPQRTALRRAFGVDQGPAPDPFLVGLAALGLVSEAARHRPLVVLVDDHQWLDRGSRHVLAFVARRLVAESVAVVFATRTVGDELRGLPETVVRGLRDSEAQTLLARHIDGPLDSRVRDQVIADAHGNPLALLELPRAVSRAELAGGFGTPGAPSTHSLEGALRRQIQDLPLPSRRLLALAAADPVGDPAVLWHASTILGIDAGAAAPALDADLFAITSRVVFRHPLIRSTAYRSVPMSDRQQIHAALAAVTDARLDPDRRAWHLGLATLAPDDDVADELERSASRVRARGGITAAAAFLERASELTSDPARRCDRAIAAASAKADAGLLDAANDLLKTVEGGYLTDLQRARADLVRAQLAMITSHGNDAAPLMLNAARRLESIDARLARETYLDAMSAALFAGRLAPEGGSMLDVSEAASAATRVLSTPGPADLLLDGLATQYNAGFDKGFTTVCEALSRYGDGMQVEEELRWMLLACLAASRVWDIERHISLSLRYLDIARASGALAHLPLALSSRFLPLMMTGDFDSAAEVALEMGAAIDAMGNSLSPYCAIVLAAWRGRRAELETLATSARVDAEHRGEGHGLTVIAWAEAVMANGRGDYRTARDRASYASACRGDGGASWWSLSELIESAARLDDLPTATAAFELLAETTTLSATDWSLGIEARSRAVVSEGASAEHLYLEAVERLARTGLRPDQGRAHLLYGEWLRRQRRRVDARTHLRAAHDLFTSIGMEAFAERAARELQATGETARRRTATPTVVTLTPQETQIARLAREGLSNPEIGARLFISARTVQYHLSKVFAKLGIHSRSQLDRALPDVDHH